MAPLVKMRMLALCPDHIFVVLGVVLCVVSLQFWWDLVVVSFQHCVLYRLAMYCEEGAVFPHEIAAFQWLVKLVTPLWRGMHHQV